ncbi:hypothetical protein AALB52_25540 [Lachnospiraceae bacterium 38-14]
MKKKDITYKTIKKYFTEDKDDDVKYRTFCTQYNKCKKGIDLLNKKGLNLENNYINQKVVYREIILNKTKYSKDNANSSCLFSNLLNNKKLSPSEMYFLSEKINSGIYREYGIIDAYYIENELIENLYHLISLTLSQLYPSKILDTLKHINFQILSFLMSEKEHTRSQS